MLGTYLPCWSLCSHYYFLPIASLYQTPGLLNLGLPEAWQCFFPLLLNDSQISSSIMQLPKCYESEEILEFGMELPYHWNA